MGLLKRALDQEEQDAERSRTPPPRRRALEEASPPKSARGQPVLDKWQQVAARVAHSRHVFLTGEAGSGKSFLLEHLRDNLPERHVALAAPTWKAAARIGGTSVHYFAGVNIGKLEQSAKEAMEFIKSRPDEDDVLARLRRTEVLILDEVSMLSPRVLDSLEELCRLVRKSDLVFGGIRCIFAGDFLQIPPVKETRLAFQAQCWNRLFAGPDQQLTLRGVHRQSNDQHFHGFLNRLRYGYIAEKDIALLLEASDRDRSQTTEWLQIYAKNKEVDSVNLSRLRRLDGEAIEYRASDTFADGLCKSAEIVNALEEQCPSVLALKLGAPVRLTHVRNSIEMHRGLEGLVIGFGHGGFPIVRLDDGRTEEIRPCIGASFQREARGPRLAVRRQIPLALAWATTLHKAQGMTLSRAATHVSDTFEPNMGYVALSRVTTSAGLKILDRLRAMTCNNFRSWVRNKLCSVNAKALDYHVKMLPERRRHEVLEGRDAFERLLRPGVFEAALKRAGFIEGAGYEYQKMSAPDWAIAEYGDVCYRCGKRGHWQSDCVE